MRHNIINESFIKYWKSLDFSNWNETDIREEFISPLLAVLGYSKNTVDNILREESLKLNKKYHRIGRKQIEIDYIPTVRLKKFWIIEAKPGKAREMNFGDFLQAHFYAIHPEINARFIVMINGWEVRVYDSISSDNWDDYTCLCSQENCDEVFAELLNILGSQSMTSYIRSYVLSAIRDSLMIEVDTQIAEEIKSSVNKIYSEAMPVIRQNARDLQRQKFREREKHRYELIQSMGLNELFIYMDTPTDQRPIYALELFRRLQLTDGSDRFNLYKKVMQTCHSRPHNIFKVQCVILLCHIYKTNLKIETEGKEINVLENLISLSKSNMRYWLNIDRDPVSQIGYALCHLDNICARIAYKLARRLIAGSISDLVWSKLEILAVEDLLVNPPTEAKEIIEPIRIAYEILWFKYKGEEPDKIWNIIWNLQVQEAIIDTIPQAEFKDGDKDFLFFDEYGLSFDMLRVGTYLELKHAFKNGNGDNIPEEISNIILESREQIIKNIPNPVEKPQGWEPELNVLL